MSIQLVAPSFKDNEKYPDIKRYPMGRTIGYINVDDHAFYVQIILTANLEDHNEQLMLVPLYDWDKETLEMLNSKISNSPIEIFYLDRDKTISKSAYIRFNRSFNRNTLLVDLNKDS